MPVSQTYYDYLVKQTEDAAKAKKEAYDNALAAYSTAVFNADGSATNDENGNMTYKKDAKGNNLYGSADAKYLENVRQTKGSAEGAGMLRSGQTARSLASQQALYRADLMGQYAATQQQKTAVDSGLATDLAKLEAEYKPVGSGSGSKPSNTSNASKPGTNNSITPPPAAPTRTDVTSAAKARAFEEANKPKPKPKPVTKKPGTAVLTPGRNIR